MKTRADMVVAPRKVSFEESLKFAIIQMKIENPSIVFPDEWCNRIIEPTEESSKVFAALFLSLAK